MDNTFDRILTRSRRRQSVESSDIKDDDNLSNVGTPTKKSRVTKRLSSKLEDVQEGNSSPPKINGTDNETNTPAKSLRGRRSLALAVSASPKPDLANSPVRNLRRSQRHSPVGSETSPSNSVNVPPGVEDNTESLMEKKLSSPSKNMLLKKDILSAHNTFDSPKPKKTQKGKNESSGTPNPRRSRRLSTELNIVQEDPIREEETDAIALKSVVKPRRGKRLSIAPLQPSLPEEIEEQEIVNAGNKSHNSSVKDALSESLNCSVKAIDVSSPNKSLSDKSITSKSNKSVSDNSFNKSKLQSEANKSLREASKSPKKMADKSIHRETDKSINMEKSLKLNNSLISESDNTKSRNKSMSALENINSRDMLNVSSGSVKEYSFRKHGDKSANLNASDTFICDTEKTVDKDFYVDKLNSSKSSNKSILEINTSTADQSKRSNRKSSSFVEHDNSKSSNIDKSTSSINKSTPSESNNSLKNLSRKSNRMSNANDTQNTLDVKNKSKISDDSQMTVKDVSVANLSTSSSRKSNANITAQDTSQAITTEDTKNSDVLNTSCPADGESSPGNSSKRSRKSAKDFFAQDNANENSPDSKSFINASKNRGKNIGDVATSTPNIFGKEVVSKAHLIKATSLNLLKKNESLNSSCNENDISKTRKNDSKMLEELHMSVTEYLPTPSKNSDKSVSNVDKEDIVESDESESIKLTFLDSASEAESHYESGDSMNESEREEIEDNEIVEKGSTLRTESSQSESESCSNDSFVCTDEPEESLLSGTGDDLSSGDNELTQSRASKMKYNLKQMKKQKDSSKEMFEARHSKDSESKGKSISHSNKKYKKIMDASSSSSDDETEYMDVDNSMLPDPLSTTVCIENGNSHSNTSIIKINSEKDIAKSPTKKTVKINESQKNETLDPLSTTVTSDKSAYGKQNQDESMVHETCNKDEHDNESLSSLSEGEEIKHITSIYEKELKGLQQINTSLKKDIDSSSDESEESEVDNLKSPKPKTLNFSPQKSPNLGNSFKDSTIHNMKSPSVSKLDNEKVNKNSFVCVKKDNDSSSNESNVSEIGKNDNNSKSPNRISKTANLSSSKSPKLGSSFKENTVNSLKVVEEKVQKNISVSLQKDNDSSCDDTENSEIEKKMDSVKSSNRKSKILMLNTSSSPSHGNSFKDSNVSKKSPSVSKMINEEVQNNKDDTSQNLNNLSAIISESESIKGRTSLNNSKRNSLNKSVKRDDSMMNDSPKLQTSLHSATFDKMNCSLKSSQDVNKSKRRSKSLNSSKMIIADEAAIELAETAVIGISAESLAKSNESNSRNNSLTLGKKAQSSPGITNLASLFKSLQESSLTLFSEGDKTSKDKDHIALATTDFKVESFQGTSKRKRKDKGETLKSTWSNTAGEFEVLKKMKTQYPTRTISASDSGCTTSFSVISLSKHPKQILKVENNSESKFPNFKEEMLYGKRVKREQSSKLFKLQQKLVSKKENFFTR